MVDSDGVVVIHHAFANEDSTVRIAGKKISDLDWFFRAWETAKGDLFFKTMPGVKGKPRLFVFIGHLVMELVTDSSRPEDYQESFEVEKRFEINPSRTMKFKLP